MRATRSIGGTSPREIDRVFKAQLGTSMNPLWISNVYEDQDIKRMSRSGTQFALQIAHALI